MRTSTRRTAVAALLRTTALALLAVGAVVGPGAGPALAADGDVAWTVRTASNGYGADRSSYSYAVNPGGRADDALVVANRGTTPLNLAVYAADGFTTGTGQLDLLPKDQKSTAVGVWLQTTSPNITVAPGKTVTVPFAVTVPANATPGDYVGGIVTSLTQTDQAQTINVDRRLGIRVKLRISGELKPSLAVEDLHVDYTGSANPLAKGDATVTYRIHNTGNAVLSARQDVSVTGPFGWLRADAGDIAAPPQLLPGESWTVTAPVHGVAPATKLTATATLTPLLTDASGSSTDLEQVEATGGTWAMPWALLILIVAVAAVVAVGLVGSRRNRARRRQREDARVEQAVEQALRDKQR
ncbi:DUF916 domain-containing protein [Catellatospora sp. NPDC049111]|uniref:WxL protein peptidoglycan domain-containing protein n=1 Tax=Catellatospora sp. NPDC049111 TaxID=3155271 RepID=UPI0033EF9638